MRVLLALLFLSACRVDEKRSVASSGVDSPVVISAMTTRPWNQPQPLPQRNAIAADTEARVTDNDSMSTAIARAQLSPSPEGDSVKEIGGAIMPAPNWVHEYMMNGVRYAAIEQEIGKKANGQPLMGEVSRVTLPLMDSTEHLMFAGLCGTDYNTDAYVLALVGLGEDTVNRVYRNIGKAWRFERASRSLREIPTKNVVCFDPGED
jgi:hypothetical protein